MAPVLYPGGFESAVLLQCPNPVFPFALHTFSVLASVAEAKSEDGAYATWIRGILSGDVGLMSGSLAVPGRETHTAQVRVHCHRQLINFLWHLHTRFVPAAQCSWEKLIATARPGPGALRYETCDHLTTSLESPPNLNYGLNLHTGTPTVNCYTPLSWVILYPEPSSVRSHRRFS